MANAVKFGWLRLFRGKTPSQILKEGWDTIPEVMASFALASVGLAVHTVYLIHCTRKKDINKKKYKFHYVVVRDTDVDDPTSDWYS